MGITTGMRGKDVKQFCIVAQRFKVIILVRQTNPESLTYIGKPGYCPKPAAIKAKTADNNPPPRSTFDAGGKQAVHYEVAGLVVHPDFQPEAYLGTKRAKARDYWQQTLELLASGLRLPAPDPGRTDTLLPWGVARTSATTGWQWRIDIDPQSKHFGCLQIKRDDIPWSYVHGDYDLKDVIMRGHEQHNVRQEGQIQGVPNYTPLLPGLEFETIRCELNRAMGVDMVQHGAEAQLAWHGDEPITVIYPEGPDLQFQILASAETVQRWYEDMNRQLIAVKGKDYLGDKSRHFWFGDHGQLFAPGSQPAKTWG